VYLVATGDGRLYTGITTDVARRLEEHRAGKGARFLRGRAPLELVYHCRVGARGKALRVESLLRRRPREDKLEVVASAPSRRALLRRLGCA